MPMFLRRKTHFVRWALLVTFALGLSANCLATAGMPEAEMACCKTITHGCGPQANAHSCCKDEPPRVAQLAAAHRITLAVPHVTVVVMAIDIPIVTTLTRATDPARDRHGSHPPSSPPYLLDSLLRI